MRTLALIAGLFLLPATARADLRGHVDGGAGYFVSGWQSREIGLGAAFGGGVELGVTPRFGVEARLAFARFSRGDAPEDLSLRRVDQSGYLALAFGARVHPLADLRGLWLGGSFGGASTGGRARPMFDLRIGWDFRTGNNLRFGPFLGYAHVIQPDEGALRPDDARLMILGVHGAFDAGPPRPPETPAPIAPAPPVYACSTCVDPLEGDGLTLPDRCPDEPDDFIGASDPDGCPDKNADVKVVGDEIVLGDRVYFDFGLANVKQKSWGLLKSLAKLINAHPEYLVIHIHGHTDEVGTDDFNQRLSEERAAAVRKMLITFGVAPSRLQSRGFGKTKPRVNGTTEAARQENRRVEFLIERKAKP